MTPELSPTGVLIVKARITNAIIAGDDCYDPPEFIAGLAHALSLIVRIEGAFDESQQLAKDFYEITDYFLGH